MAFGGFESAGVNGASRAVVIEVRSDAIVENIVIVIVPIRESRDAKQEGIKQ